MSHYRAPGLPPPPAPAPQPNTYLQPSAVAQQLIAPPAPSPPPPPQTPQARDQDPHHGTLLAEWRAHHAGDWVRADGLSATVRRMIDPKDRIPAIRQRLRQLVASCPELETKITGNAAKRAMLYRVIETA